MQSCRFQTLHVCLLITGLLTESAAAQAVATTSHLEIGAESVAQMNPDQKVRFDTAAKAFGAGDYAAALPPLRQLVEELPADSFLAKYAAEAAINVGEYSYTAQLVSSVLSSNPNDWQAHTLRARLAAQQGDSSTRDTEIAQLASLRQKGIVPQQLTQFPIERVKVGNKSLLIFQSLFPWGNFKVHNYARLFDSTGKLEMRMTLESSDFDQPGFAKQHPEAAAAGDRLFSYDGYRDMGTNAQGQHSEMHMTFGFVEKEPTYEQMKARFIQIADAQAKASSSNTHPIP